MKLLGAVLVPASLGLCLGLGSWAMLWWVGGTDDGAWAAVWLSGLCLGGAGLLGGMLVGVEGVIAEERGVE